MRFKTGFPRVLAITAIAVLVLTLTVETPTAHGLGTFTSQGVQAHHSAPWNQVGFNGQGIRVGIIDVGPGSFLGYRSLMGSDLPATVKARCYTGLGQFTANVADCDRGNDHGTTVAESIVDVSPGASLYIANPGTPGDLRATVDWMIGEGVTVINHPISWEFDGPGDGTSPFIYSPLNTVDRAVDAGIIWTSPAGNEALQTWFGPPTFTDGGLSLEFVIFSGFDFMNDMDLQAGDRVLVDLRWDDSWTGATRDLDLGLWSYADEEYVELSFDLQEGRPGELPLESLTFTAERDGTYGIDISISIEDIANKPQWVQLTVLGDVAFIEHHTGAGSIGNPAESANPGILATGAAHWSDTASIEFYSSRGPTPDGRTKPDVGGADCGVTSRTPLDAYGDGFCGTSQSSAHVAGMAALVRQRFPAYSPVQVADYLKDNAAQRESPDPNNTWGHGFAQLPLPPAIETACATGGAVTNAAANPGLVSDCAALLTARDTLAGTVTLDWSDSIPIGNWSGVTLGSTPQRVTDLNLRNTGLMGTIPAELSTLAKLERLDLGVNLTCDSNGCRPEPPSVNQLTGSIPAELGNLANLTWLSISGNQLTGSIPAELGSLANLTWLSISGNQLTGSIPAELGNLTNLESLWLWGNQLTGSIPVEFGSLANLQNLYLSDNQLTGCIPAGLRGVAANDLDDLGLPDCGDPAVPGAPTGLTAAANGQTQIDLSWNRPSNDGGAAITGYRIEISANGSTWGDLVANTGSTSTSYSHTGLTAGSTRHYRVSAIDSEGTGRPSNVASATTTTAPAAPCLESLGVLTAPVTRMGTWADDCDSEARPGSYARYYSFTLDQAGQVEIDLTSATEDAYLVLREGEARTGRLVASNDNVGPRNLNSSINEELDARTYTIEATTYFPGLTGDFTLSVRPPQETENLGPQPSVVVSHAAGSAAALVRLNSPISLTSTFSEPVSGFTLGDISIGNGTGGNLAGSGAVYTFEVTPDAIGEVTVDIAAGVAADAGGDGNTAAPQFSLGIPYDDDGDGGISKPEVIKAIRDYFTGSGGITKASVIALIRLYFTG